ncbi:TPA: hypothetical protein U1C94_002096 [Streptococcus suis]|uniref:hypothetical protein n=1 Tax=Streptococcus suis TaxID=1307 RepID=UPI001ABE3A36|nr:hypothetical protein [Streptococcus suis]MBO4110787.1 hypothetical protein [Streptococcus suis]HEM3668431.1 hypothetical protein [Streptococcus suis]HEM3705735.1 hypothetical protein [Streptococcus suis]HEM3722582.1 hypothetical protein [Streptococcus suis]
MIEKIGQETRVSLGKKRLLQSCLFEENYVNIGERFLNSRESFREFSKDATPKSILEDLMDYYERFKQNLSLFSLSEDDVSFCFVDNKSMISREKKIYKIVDKNIEEIILEHVITEDSLYIQEEMHYATVVIFFLWNTQNLEKVDTVVYKDILFMSGFFGHQLSILAAQKETRGTVFAGITLVEFYGLTKHSFDTQMPVFAFAIE